MQRFKRIISKTPKKATIRDSRTLTHQLTKQTSSHPIQRYINQFRKHWKNNVILSKSKLFRMNTGSFTTQSTPKDAKKAYNGFMYQYKPPPLRLDTFDIAIFLGFGGIAIYCFSDKIYEWWSETKKLNKENEEKINEYRYSQLSQIYE